jgi:hypothetical protein
VDVATMHRASSPWTPRVRLPAARPCLPYTMPSGPRLLLQCPRAHSRSQVLLLRSLSSQPRPPWPGGAPSSLPRAFRLLHVLQPSQAVTGPGNIPYAMYTLDRSRCRCLLLVVIHRAPPLPWPSFSRHRNSLPLVSSRPNESHQHLCHLASHLPRLFPGSDRRCSATAACSRRRASGLVWPEAHGHSQATLRVAMEAPRHRVASEPLHRRRVAGSRPAEPPPSIISPSSASLSPGERGRRPALSVSPCVDDRRARVGNGSHMAVYEVAVLGWEIGCA